MLVGTTSILLCILSFFQYVSSQSSSGSATYTAATTVTTSTASLSTQSLSTSTSTATATATPPTYTLATTFEIGTATTTRSYTWTIAKATASPDGYTKEVYAINGQMPGPLIEANEGDTVVVTVQNDLVDESTTIHWHGLFQNGTQTMDGVPGFSQCPIPAGSSWTYTFSTEGQSGTYWYHSHSSVQYTDGILGPFIIHSPSEYYTRGTSYDSEVVLLMQDWYHNSSSDIATQLLSVDGYLGSPAAPSPQSNLINGQGVFNCSLLSTSDDAVCTTPDDSTLTLPAERIRFRLINGGSHAQELVSIDTYELNVTAADGTALVGSSVQRIPIHNGERYDFIVDFTNSTDGDSVWLRAEMNTNCFASIDDTLNATAAVALYIGSAGSTPTTDAWSEVLPTDCVDLDSTYLVPAVSEDAPSLTDSTSVKIFDSAFGTLTTSSGVDYSRFFMNSTSYTNYIYRPLLATIANGSSINSSDIAYVTASDDEWVVDIVINNKDGGLDHPYHLHGMEFYIVARGSGVLTLDDWSSLTFNTSNPLRRDTLVIPGGNYAVLRIDASVKGVWPLHCHIAWHLAEGFMGAVVIHPDAIQSDDLWTSEAQGLCNSGLEDGASTSDTEPGRRRRRRSIQNMLNVARPQIGRWT